MRDNLQMEEAFVKNYSVRKNDFAQYKGKSDIFNKICILFVVLMKYQPIESLK